MLLKMAISTVWHEKEKLSGAVVGVALGVFLVVFQWGLYFAYKRDTTVVLDAFDADLWIVPKNQTMFDGFTSMDDLACRRAKEVAGIEDAARVVWGDADWRLPNSGGKDYIQVLGLDLESSIAARFHCTHHADQEGETSNSPLLPLSFSALLRGDGHVLIGALDRKKLGVTENPRGPFEIAGRRAFVEGYVDDVRLFTTAGFVLTDIDNARAFLRLPGSHVNFIVCKCRPGAAVPAVAAQLQALVPEHDVLTARQFHDLCCDYWEKVSGIGPLIFVSSVLGIAVGFLIVITTFYISTLEKVPVYGCLKALGGSAGEIAALVAVQVFVVFLLGSAIAGAALWATLAAVRGSMISLLVTPELVAAGLGTMLALRRFRRADLPPQSFRHRPRRGLPHMSNGAPDTVLRLEDLRKEFPEPSGVLHVLRGITLSVRRGEIVMLMGPSGSGKTTLLQIAGCLIRATSGRVEIAGRDFGRARESVRLRARRKHLGFVFQSFHLVDALTAYDNVALAQHCGGSRSSASGFFKCSTSWASLPRPKSSPATSAAAKSSGSPSPAA